MKAPGLISIKGGNYKLRTKENLVLGKKYSIDKLSGNRLSQESLIVSVKSCTSVLFFTANFHNEKTSKKEELDTILNLPFKVPQSDCICLITQNENSAFEIAFYGPDV